MEVRTGTKSIPYKSGIITTYLAGTNRIEQRVEYHVLGEGPLRASTVNAAKRDITVRLREHPGLPILSIDAWRDPEGGWTWNEVHRVSPVFPAELVGESTRRILNWFRSDDVGLLSDGSVGRTTVEDDGTYITVFDRTNNEPLFAVDLQSIS